MTIKATRSRTITTLMKRLFSPTDPCQLKARFPRRTAKITRVVEATSFRAQPCGVKGKGEQHCEPTEPKAWPYDTALPSGLPPIEQMPNPRPDLTTYHLPLHALNRSLPGESAVDVLI